MRLAGAGDPWASDVVYAEDPVAQARAFLAAGATWLHLVDLDRAFATGRANDDVIGRIAGLPGAMVQVGGSLRTGDDVRGALDRGAARAVVATGAAADGPAVEQIARAVGGGRLAVAIDVRHGALASRIGTIPPGETPATIARRAIDLGVNYVIYRDLLRDGSLGGADLAGAAAVGSQGAQVIVAGGVSSTFELAAACRAGIFGAIIGRAFYEGRLSVAEAMACSG